MKKIAMTVSLACLLASGAAFADEKKPAPAAAPTAVTTPAPAVVATPAPAMEEKKMETAKVNQEQVAKGKEKHKPAKEHARKKNVEKK